MPETHPMPDSAEQAPESSLAVLMAAIAKKHRPAFENFYDATVPRIYSLALRITRQHEAAEEVVSDVYLQVWLQAARYDPARGNVMAWLTVLCRSRALDALRRNKPSMSENRLDDNLIPEAENPEHPQNLLMAVEQQAAIHSALQRLDAQQRQLLALAYFRGYSHSELAQVTGLPIGTVKTQLRRTLISLKSMMSGTDDGLGELK